MKEYKFCNGQKLRAIYWRDGSILLNDEVDTIDVIMECGQMAAIAWAIVIFKNGKIQKYNLAYCEGIEFLERGKK
jgi:hypothetical protein